VVLEEIKKVIKTNHEAKGCAQVIAVAIVLLILKIP
jgi:hypothetical protein